MTTAGAPGGGFAATDFIPSGIAGLDAVLEGGFLKSGVYIIQGEPGAGKTILANQICFNHIGLGGRALYITLLAESHARMLAHIGQLSFFDASAFPEKLSYISAFRVLEEDGLKGLLTLMRREIQARNASLIILDGLVAAEESAGTPREFKKFIHELQTQAVMTGATMFLLTSSSAVHIPVAAEHTMVDGVIEVRSRLYGRRAERDLEVLKRRGSGYLRGRHSFRITSTGVTVYPRIEALLAYPSNEFGETHYRISTGVPQLDDMVGGGLVRPSSTMVAGPAGVGKTTLGMHFLGGSSAEEPGLMLSFQTTPAATLGHAGRLGLPLVDLARQGHVELWWQPSTEGLLDEIMMQLLDKVRERKVRRLFIDGIEGFYRLAVEEERVNPAFTALMNEFRALGVSTLYSTEVELSSNIGGFALAGLGMQDASPVAENIFIMRYAELRSELHRLIAVLKARNSRIDRRVRRYEMTDNGIVVDKDAESAEGILAELQSSGAPPSSRRSVRRSGPRGE